MGAPVCLRNPVVCNCECPLIGALAHEIRTRTDQHEKARKVLLPQASRFSRRYIAVDTLLPSSGAASLIVMTLVAFTVRLVTVAFLYPEHLAPGRNPYEFAYEVGRVARSIALAQQAVTHDLFASTRRIPKHEASLPRLAVRYNPSDGHLLWLRGRVFRERPILFFLRACHCRSRHPDPGAG
jgi:hypothetical protein